MKQDEFESLSIFEQATITPAYQQGFQAGAASRDAEIAKWNIAYTSAAEAATLIAQERDQLRAQSIVLREALDEAMYSNSTATAKQKAAEALSSTPEQSLAEYRNKVIEECAALCDRFAAREMHPAECASAIRAMKED